ncbi:MAG: hypothetical protein HN926_06485 [Chloroflexi bacterium]|jgi:hypothetical protein|nr:hypothetical protein [Chloroflexota bacterium]MBT4943626.1 hypothetical protein [Chloroflexota bacterium]MBT5476755.1 hypothetical protein [Chloroflexota bacterium]MBT7078997.1 hypothetical protein [Chloroflexota bacterium]MBT7467658.1 hypothetical protein [Chloroflexota bacterium]
MLTDTNPKIVLEIPSKKLTVNYSASNPNIAKPSHNNNTRNILSPFLQEGAKGWVDYSGDQVVGQRSELITQI